MLLVLFPALPPQFNRYLALHQLTRGSLRPRKVSFVSSAVATLIFNPGVRIDAFQSSEFVLGRLLVSSVRATVLFDSGASHSFIAPFYLTLFVSIFGSKQSHSFISRCFMSSIVHISILCFNQWHSIQFASVTA